MSTLSTLEANSLKGALEALLLVSSDPVSAPALAGALDIAPGECASLLAELKVEYEEANRGFQLREVAGGWRLFTHPAYHDAVEAYVLSWDTQKLSQAALETLAVIAYHQPVTREVVKGIRGVNSDGVIASLVDKGLVRELGRDPQRGLTSPEYNHVHDIPFLKSRRVHDGRLMTPCHAGRRRPPDFRQCGRRLSPFGVLWITPHGSYPHLAVLGI